MSFLRRLALSIDDLMHVSSLEANSVSCVASCWGEDCFGRSKMILSRRRFTTQKPSRAIR